MNDPQTPRGGVSPPSPRPAVPFDDDYGYAAAAVDQDPIDWTKALAVGALIGFCLLPWIFAAYLILEGVS